MLATVLVGCVGKEEPKVVPEMLITDAVVEWAIHGSLKKPKGELTKADLEKMTEQNLDHSRDSAPQLTDVKSLEKLTQLEHLILAANKLTDVNGLEKLTQLTWLDLGGNRLTDVEALETLTQLKVLWLDNNPDLTKAQIAELKKALPKCKIYGNPKK